MACTVDDTYETPGFESFICKIAATYADESVLTEDGKINYHVLKPVLFEMPTYEYLKTGEVLGKCMSFGKDKQGYSSDYDECLDRAADEKADNARPALASHVDNMEDYDIVFLGFPNWWYTLPMPVLTFVEEYDWSGKTVVPFVTHGTGGLASTIRDLTAALPEDVTILEPIGVYRPEVDGAQSAVQEWIAGLNLELPQGGNGQSQEEETSAMENTRRIRFSLDDGAEIIVRLNDNPAADALYEMLPLELSFEDFNRTEKIAYLPEEIPSDGSPDQCDPDVGSLCCYIPWGNLCFFYQDFRASSSLIPLGQVETGAEFLAQLDLASRVSVEAADGET